FVTNAQTLGAGSCSGTVILQSRDTAGAAANVLVPVPVTLGMAGGAFYSDSACSVAVAGAVIAAGTDSASFWFTGSIVSTQTVSATSSLTNPTQLEVINIGPV